MIVYGSPNRYIQGPNVVFLVGKEVQRLGNSAILLADRTVFTIVGKIIEESCLKAGIKFKYLEFSGEMTDAEIQKLYALSKIEPWEVVIGAGGGKAIDCGKALAHALGARVVTLPTIASNDSPTSHIYVIYDENHKLLRVEKGLTNPDLVLVDTEIIVKSPSILFAAGIGDAVVKSFEVSQCVSANGPNIFGKSAPLLALTIANNCYSIIREYSILALSSQKKGISNEAFEKVVEATILMSGLAFENGGLSISHAMTRGLSAVKGPAESLHGLQVAYGLLVQLVLEQRNREFVAEMKRFFSKVDLPTCLSDLNFSGNSKDINLIAELAFSAPHTKNFFKPLTVKDIADAICTVESVNF